MNPHPPAVLVVENDLETAEFIRFLLAQEGYEVRVAHSAAAAAALIHNTPPSSAVLLDPYVWPDHGKSIISMLRELEQWREVPVLTLSPLDPAHAALHAGAQDWVEKPIAACELIRRVKRWTKAA